MKFLDSLRMALEAMVAHRLRSALTLLGIVIGITAVISLMAMGQGMRQQVLSQFQGLGSNLLFISPGAVTQGGVRGATGSAATLTLDDAEAVSQVPGVAVVAPEAATFTQVVSPQANMRARVVGTTPDFLEARSLSLREGEFITPYHVQARSMVAVLGAAAADTLFPNSSPLEERVRLGRNSFRVIGVLQSQGGGFMAFLDEMVVIPVTTAQTRFAAERTAAGGQRLQTIYVRLADMEAKDKVVGDIAEVLRERHRVVREDDFTITSLEDITRAVGQVMGMFTIFLGGIAGISLLVGGIGVMNIMLVSVAERTREVGIRKAVGARRRDIMLQFLLEAVTLSLAGGVIGVLGGLGISLLLSGATFYHPAAQRNFSIGGTPSPEIVLLALGVSVLVGVFFGVYPASRAASLPPVEALRHE